MIPQHTFTKQEFFELCEFHAKNFGKELNATRTRKILKEFKKRATKKKNDMELIQHAYYFTQELTK